MDKANNDGGQAFPGAVPLPDARGEFAADFAFFGGMTLRDYFAAKAPPYRADWFTEYCRTRGFTSRARAQADWSFHYADTMLAARGSGDTRFQAGVEAWMDECFLPSLYSDMTERGDRLLEEVLELLQAHGYDRSRVATLVDYVYGRPAGDPAQEVGGVMVTLAGFCWIAGHNMHVEGARELERITRPEVMDKIRAKQAAKNALHFDTPLPGSDGPDVSGGCDSEGFPGGCVRMGHAPETCPNANGLALIAAERARQQRHPNEGGEGWSQEHDDNEHDAGQLARAAACYATPPDERTDLLALWPWSFKWWKPGDRIRELVKAGALIAAEIDRLLRKQKKGR